MKKQILITAVFLLGLFIRMSLAVEFTLLGPNKYLRTTGKPDVYNDTFRGTIALGKLILTNGTSDGKNRVSSALILINGQQILGPSNFNQQVYKLEVPINLIENNTISVRLASAPESYITVKITEEVPADATSSEVIGPQGGIVSVQNHLGDRMTLEILPLALADSVPISLTALAIPPTNPICTNIFPGVVLEPSGTIFSLPVKIKVDFHEALANPSAAMLFWLKNSNCVVPIGNHAGTQNGIEGETTHFSPIIVGAPTADEIFMQIAEIIARGGDTSALGILETIDDYYAIMRFAETLRILGEDQKAAEAENSARGLLQERTLQLLSSPQPANPCGQYSNALTQLSDLIIAALGDTSLAALVAARTCTLTVTPSSLNLSPGDTADLTAVLTDPTGSQHTCSSLPWYSSDLDVAQIAVITGSSCTIKAGIEGAANISANCDGLIGSAKITVASAPPGVEKYKLIWRIYTPDSSWEEQYTDPYGGYSYRKTTISNTWFERYVIFDIGPESNQIIDQSWSASYHATDYWEVLSIWDGFYEYKERTREFILTDVNVQSLRVDGFELLPDEPKKIGKIYFAFSNECPGAYPGPEGHFTITYHIYGYGSWYPPSYDDYTIQACARFDRFDRWKPVVRLAFEQILPDIIPLEGTEVVKETVIEACVLPTIEFPNDRIFEGQFMTWIGSAKIIKLELPSP